jgi:hypothetical protein
MQSGGGIAGTDSQQAVDGENRGARCRPACMLSTGLIWRETGDKVVDNKLINDALAIAFFCTRILRLAPPHPGHVLARTTKTPAEAAPE